MILILILIYFLYMIIIMLINWPIKLNSNGLEKIRGLGFKHKWRQIYEIINYYNILQSE